MDWTSPELARSLVGKKISAASWDDDGVVFETDRGRVAWRVEGGCCSKSWVELADLDCLVGHAVSSVEQVPLPESWYLAHPGPKEQDSLRLYGVNIRCPGGTATIDFRNESNGYYGGSMEVAETADS